MEPILDACCGSKMFWYDKDNPFVIFMDNREENDILCDGRKLIVKPDIVADFRNMPFPDNTYGLVVFDPPHLISAVQIHGWPRSTEYCQRNGNRI